jgi:carboxylesterase type B
MSKYFEYDNVPVVSTTSGDVKGYKYDGVYIHKGIVYAEADRFQAPKPSKWEGVKDATNFGCVCPLMSPETPSGELMVPHRYWPQNEHCQSLNIWSTTLDEGAKQPVLVWFHGGGYAAGSSIEQVAYDGMKMAKQENVVLVTVNHRLNILGYLDLSPFGKKYENSANAGHADMVAALQWVHDNIAKFGGDPENVTIFGQSGGGMKCIDLMQIPAADGLFQKSLVMSGVMQGADFQASSGDGTEIVNALMAELKLDKVEKLETVPYANLVAAYQKVSPEVAKKGAYIGGGPKPGDWYVGNPFNVGWREHAYSIPMMIGTVYGEFAFNIPNYDKYSLTDAEVLEKLTVVYGEGAKSVLDAFKKAYPEKNGTDAISIDRAMREPTVKLAKLFAEKGTAYNYNFTYEFPFHHGKTAWHCSDIPYFFLASELVEVCANDDREKLETEVGGSLMAFAKNGNPNHSAIPEWKPVSADSCQTMVFDKKTELKVDYDDAVFDEINKVLKPFNFYELMSQNIQH